MALISTGLSGYFVDHKEYLLKLYKNVKPENISYGFSAVLFSIIIDRHNRKRKFDYDHKTLGEEDAPQATQNNKAPGENEITTELLRASGKPVIKILYKLVNSVIHKLNTPETWSRSVVVLFFKKGDNTLLKNYRPISLLSHVYKLFSRVITNCLEHRFDDCQPPEQSGFRKGFSILNHIHTTCQVIEKTEEYNQPLCLAYVDYEKAFDSTETWVVLQSLPAISTIATSKR